MFNNNKKQFINILQQNKQLKINYKTIQDDKIIKEEQSSFLISNDKIPEDAKFKINALQKDISQTYITSLIENPNQEIVNTSNVDVIAYDSVKIADTKSIVIPKNEINSIKHYFEDTGIDYLLSPYTILEKYLQENDKKNSLNLLIYNDIIYMIILNEQKELVFSKTKTLTSFESTQDESFAEDDIVGQKLYEEVNFLEIQQFLTQIVEEYYASASEVEFLEQIQIIYALKPLSESQIAQLKEQMMMPISYRSISFNNYIDDIVQSNESKIHNFIIPRVKKESNNFISWLLLAVVTIGLVVAIFNYQFADNKEIKKDEPQKQTTKQQPVKEKEVKVVKPTTILLPNHTIHNKMVVQNVQMLFDIIPYNAILKDIEINKNGSTYVSNFLTSSNSLIDMQTKLKNIYNDSKVLLQNKNKVLENTIIQNENIKEKYNFNKKVDNVKYKLYQFLPTAKATSYIQSVVIDKSLVKFEGKTSNEFTTYNFNITSQVKSPKEFFTFINNLNSQNLSIELDYPITFSKTNKYLEVKYNLKLHQQLKKQVQLSK